MSFVLPFGENSGGELATNVLYLLFINVKFIGFFIFINKEFQLMNDHKVDNYLIIQVMIDEI